jgi:hypothetical protein
MFILYKSMVFYRVLKCCHSIYLFRAKGNLKLVLDKEKRYKFALGDIL